MAKKIYSRNSPKTFRAPKINAVFAAGDSLPISPLAEPSITSKSDFISIATHQLKTPLGGNKWALNYLLSGNVGPISPAQKEILERVYESNEKAIHLIDDMLRADREESEIFKLNPTGVNLLDLIERIIGEINSDALRKNISLEFTKYKDTIPKIIADPEKMNYVFENVIENAVRYSKAGGLVSISVNQEDDKVVVAVTDSGVGIPIADQGNIFKKFFRAMNARKTEYGGTGLGLFITKRIVEEHGGKIWFKSEEGKGTTFWVALPMAGV